MNSMSSSRMRQGKQYGIKPVKPAMELMPYAKMELTYEGGKEMLLVEDVDNKEFLHDLLQAMYEELPAVKKK